MTQQQLDYRIYEVKSLITDKFKDIQTLAQSLETPEGNYKVTLQKITDAITDINRFAYEIEELETVVPNGDENDNEGVCYL